MVPVQDFLAIWYELTGELWMTVAIFEGKNRGSFRGICRKLSCGNVGEDWLKNGGSLTCRSLSQPVSVSL